MREIDLEEVEPTIVDLTTDPRYPIFSVRMPLSEIISTHENEYIEILYRLDCDNNTTYELNLSTGIAEPVMTDKSHRSEFAAEHAPKNYPARGELGRIKTFYIAVKKLKDFHEQRGFEPTFAKYGLLPPLITFLR